MPTAKRKARTSHPPSPIIRIAHSPKPWELNAEQVAILKNAIAKGSTDDELKYCLEVAKRYRMDPFRKQIWFVKRRMGESSHRWIPIVGIDGMLHVAARDHKDFGTADEPEFGPMHEVSWRYENRSGKFPAPEWARVKVWKKGSEHPTVATVYWDEIYPNVDSAPLVRQMPRLMLGKCALAQAIRRSYPETGGLYIKEEFQGPPEFTDSGRRIVYPEIPQQASSDAAEYQRLKNRTPEEIRAEINAAMGKPDQSVKPGGVGMGSDNPSTGAGFPADQTRPVIELDWSEDESSPVVRGDIAGILDTLQANLHMTWANDWWHIEPRDLEPLRKICEFFRYELKQILPSSSGNAAPEKGGVTLEQKPTHTGKSGTSESKAERTGPAIAFGTVNQVLPGMTGKGAPTRQVKVNGHWHWCYKNPLFEYIDKALGIESEFILDAKKTIVGIKRIGSRQFDEEGLPIIDKNEDRSGKLF